MDNTPSVQEVKGIRWWEALSDPDETFKKGVGNCEICGRHFETDPAKIYISVRVYGKKPGKTVLFTCNRCEVPGCYDIQLSRFLSHTEGPVEWLSHLCEKNWLDAELALRFIKAMVKVRDLVSLTNMNHEDTHEYRTGKDN